MSSEMMKYAFEGSEIRVILDENGDPWFNANDVCGVLGYKNPHDALSKHVPIGCLAQREAIDSLGRVRQSNYINEKGLNLLVMACDLPAAQRIREWLAGEVMPAIRKTGSYSTGTPLPRNRPRTPSVISDRLKVIRFALGITLKVPGVNPAMATARALSLAEESTGVAVRAMQEELPARTGPAYEYNATKIGELIGGYTAKATNKLLEKCGLIKRNAANKWELTAKGCDYGEVKTFEVNGHSGTHMRWSEAVVQLLKDEIKGAAVLEAAGMIADPKGEVA